jgi:hypothetical protein
MDQTAARLMDHALTHLPVRPCVLSVPKRLRYFMQCDGAALNTALHIFPGSLSKACTGIAPGAAQLDNASVRIGAAAFIHCLESSLNTHVHFHV